MYKDFKKSESLDTGFVGGSGILWMFSGIILGLLVGLGMYYFANNKGPVLSSVDSVQQKIATAQSTRAFQSRTSAQRVNKQFKTTTVKPVSKTSAPGRSFATASDRSASSSREPRRNNFSYYAVLPTLDVPVGAARPIKTSIKDMKVDEGTADKVALLEVEDVHQEPVASSDGGYLLQVASFKRRDRANKTIKRLTQKGLSAYVQEKRVKGRTWYRVIAGPVGSEGIDSWKLKAQKLGHQPITISVR